ncbi:MAG: CBS domain-containing protein [Chitinivibrionales bacterium]|nr:CBS domain-containing protein [Chitinivibrionales bacterium]MBD3358814.1 CBS domain-containing protein [Chitinivibrionales bacterium]
MFGNRVTLFKLFGFSVRIDASWLIIAVLVVWSLATSLFPYYYEGLATETYWWMGVLGAIGLFGSIIFHEMCHSLAARRFGMPMEGITLFVFGGVAEMEEEPPSAKAELVMAVAGPLASIGIGFAGFGLVRLGENLAWGAVPLGVLRYVMLINLILAGFNLLPAFPLDGGRVLRSILWSWKKDLNWATRIASKIGSGFGFLLIFFGIFAFISGAFVGGIWWFLIGMFLRGASQASYRQMMVHSSLRGQKVKRFMKTEPITVGPSVTVRDFVEDYVYKHHFKMFPVVNDGVAPRCVTTRNVKEVPREDWETKTVGEISSPCSEDNTVRTDTDAEEALASMRKNGTGRFMVLDENGKLAGILTLKDLLDFIALKVQLEGGGGDDAAMFDRQ